MYEEYILITIPDCQDKEVLVQLLCLLSSKLNLGVERFNGAYQLRECKKIFPLKDPENQNLEYKKRFPKLDDVDSNYGEDYGKYEPVMNLSYPGQSIKEEIPTKFGCNECGDKFKQEEVDDDEDSRCPVCKSEKGLVRIETKKEEKDFDKKHQ